MFRAGSDRACRRQFAVGRRRRSCWRRNGSTRTWRCRTRTISSSCGWRFGLRQMPIPSRQGTNGVRPFRRALRRADRGRRHARSQSAGRQFGPAQLDRAILDALCRSLVVRSMKRCATTSPASIPTLLRQPRKDLAGFDMPRFLAQLTPAASIAARHTVGLVDVIGGHPATGRRWAAGIAGGSRRGLRPPLFQAQGRRRSSMPIWQRLTEIAAVLDAHRRAVFRLARRQRAIQRYRSAARIVAPDAGRAATATAGRGHPVHRAADHPRPRAR